MNARIAWTTAGVAVTGGALLMTQMSFHAQDRQYKKTLKLYHDGREKAAEKYQQIPSPTSKDK